MSVGHKRKWVKPFIYVRHCRYY